MRHEVRGDGSMLVVQKKKAVAPQRSFEEWLVPRHAAGAPGGKRNLGKHGNLGKPGKLVGSPQGPLGLPRSWDVPETRAEVVSY